MAFNGTTIKEGATTVSASGGTDVTTSSLGIQGNVNTFVFSTDTSNTTRRLLKASVSPSNLNANSPGGRTLQRTALKLTIPRVLANGDVVEEYYEVRAGTHPETTTANVEAGIEHVVQLALPAKSQAFWFSGDLS